MRDLCSEPRAGGPCAGGAADDLLAGLFAAPVVAMAAALPAGLADLFVEERAAVAGAVAERQREFAAGRVCARRLLAALGAPDAHLPRAANGRPQWPMGFVGAIAHAHGLCVAAVARRSEVASIGVDVEADGDLVEDAWEVVCSGRERDWLRRQPAARRGRLATALFSAKECAFKCLAAGSNEPFDPRRIAVQWDGRGAVFHATFGAAAPAAGSLAIRHGWILAGMTLTA
jgi:4'-phosphopantetheinyl transferase EntD